MGSLGLGPLVVTRVTTVHDNVTEFGWSNASEITAVHDNVSEGQRADVRRNLENNIYSQYI